MKVKIGRHDPCPCGSGKKLETLTDSDLACNPGVQSVIWHGVSPLTLIRRARRGVRYFESRRLSMGAWPEPGMAG